jgi:hypothetical protein
MQNTACLPARSKFDERGPQDHRTASLTATRGDGFCNPRGPRAAQTYCGRHALSLPRISRHAARRMQQSRISIKDIETAMDYGHFYMARQAAVFVVGRREIGKYSSARKMPATLNGLHVICSVDLRCVITVYRNPELKRSSLDAKRRGHHPRRFRRRRYL